MYRSTGYNDELSFGAAWLYRATGEADYLAKAQEFQNLGTPWAYSWDDKNVGAQVRLFLIKSFCLKSQAINVGPKYE